MEPIRLDEAARAMGGVLEGESARQATSVCTDTRKGAAGALFFALQGEKSDGHAFVPDAVAQGAAAVVVSRRVEAPSRIVVDDPLRALGDLAGWHRRRLSLAVVGVTGSVGKTSTKEMAARILSQQLRTGMNAGNYNNEIGVPLTLFELDSSAQAAVIEMGMRGPGQIARLADIAAPRLGIVTNIGVSHLELLGSREAIAAAKAELLERLPADGTAAINADDDFAEFLRSRASCSVVTFGQGARADLRATNVRILPPGETRFRIQDQEFRIGAAGAHHAVNAAAACAAALALGVPLRLAAEALAAFKPPPMRMELLPAGRGTLVLNDAYNAAPDSVRSALDSLARLGTGRRRVAVLGDMKELGSESERAHREAGEAAARAGVDLLLAVGELAAGAALGARRAGLGAVETAPTTEAAAELLPRLIRPGDAVLVKGSRAMGLERLVRVLVDLRDEDGPRHAEA